MAPTAGGTLLALSSRPCRQRPDPGERTARTARIVGLAGVAWLLAAAAGGQYFGRNQVSGPRFQWRVLRTAHFDLDHYPEEEAAAREEARLAERWYDRLAALFGAAPPRRTPIIVYANQDDFRQTAHAPARLGEDTGAILEPLSGRIVLPLTGDSAENERLLAHQLARIFESELLRRQRRRQPLAALAGRPSVPRWMSDGLAEYLAVGRESTIIAAWLRDALLRNDLPDLGALSRHPRFLGYRWGHAFWAYVGGRWGDATAVRLYERTIRVGTGAAIRQILGLTPLALAQQWQAAIRTAYAGFLAARRDPAGRRGAGGGGGDLGEVGERLIPRQGAVHEQNVAPALSPDGSRIAFLSTRQPASFDLYLADARTGGVRARLLANAANPRFADLRLVDAAGGWSPDGTRFAAVAWGPAGSQIALIDVGSGRIERRIGVPGAGAISDPAWSPDGSRVAFTATNAGSSRIFLLELSSGRARPLTGGGHSDLQPAWSPDGNTLAFASDRSAGERGTSAIDAGPGPGIGTPHIWLLDLAAGGPPRPAMALPPAGDSQVDPQFGPGGRDLFFVSDRGGVSDVYRLELDGGRGGRLFQVTRAATGVSGVTRLSPALGVAARGGSLAISVIAGGHFEIRFLDAAAARGRPIDAGEPAAVVPPGSPAATAGERHPAGGAPLRVSLLPPLPPGSRVPPAVLAPAAADLAHTAPGPPQDGERIVPYHPRLTLAAVSPGLDLDYNSLGYAIGGDVSVLLSDAVERYQLRGSLQDVVSAFHEVGGEASFLDRDAFLQWGVDVGRVPAVSGFAKVAELPAAVPGAAAGGAPVRRLAIDQIYQLVVQDQESLLLQYPFSSTQRLQASASYSNLGFASKDVRQVLAGSQVVSTSRFDLPTPASLRLLQGILAMVGDTSVAGDASPASGQRYRLEVATTTGDLHFEQVTADYRHYFFFRPWTLAVRALHLGRYGPDAESDRLVPLYVGDATLVRGYDLGSLSASECTTTPGSTACPEFDRLSGSRLAVANAELRVPLFGRNDYRLVALRFLPTELAAFVDMGTAWSAHAGPHLVFATHSTERIPVASTGVAARVLIAGLAVAQVYVAKPFQRPQKGAVTGILISPGW
ncbi:MAG TPA: BamA/TamA family outer membrane protein [Thermoanaerobaculia bacterium]|nr:BamA/TamA family outer membrane protein [Thermoanaerobaculia bacterium]